MIFVLIPSYNDSKNFDSLFLNIAREFNKANIRFEIILVDDGSIDDTAERVMELSKKYKVKRIGYKKNRGPGYAFKFGFNYLLPKVKDNDFVVTMEADNSCDFSILLKMINLAKSYDVVLSSPFATGGKFLGLDGNRKLLSEISRRLDGVIFNLNGVKTYSSFYRVYRATIIKKAYATYKSALITESGFSAVVELLIKLSNLNASLCEVPAILDWRKRKGKSKMRIGKTIYNHLLLYANYFKGKYNHG